MTTKTLNQGFKDAFTRYAQKTAIRFLRNGNIETEFSYDRLNQHVNRMASAFMNKGVKKGDRVILCLEKSPASVHPELIEVLPKGADFEGDNKFEGKVVEMIYQGDFTEMKIALGQTGEHLTANLSSMLDQKTQFSLGEEVLVHWSPKSSNTLLG